MSSSLSPLQTQRTASGHDTSQGEDVSSVLNLFVSVTNSESTGIDFSLKVTSNRNKYRNAPQNSQACTHGVEEPHRCSDQEAMEEEESVLDVALSQLLKEECSEIKELAEAWISTYESSQFEALRSMLELILHSTGVLQMLTKAQALKLDQLTAETLDVWMGEPHVNPLILEDLFLKNFLKFLRMTLVGDVCLDDTLMMKRIQQLLEVFTQSTWVCTRYAALMIGSLITAQYTMFVSQLDTELRDVLTTGNETDLRESMAVAKNFFEAFIDVVILCQRDVILTVRKLACEIYFSWCVKQQPLLMTDKYLRFVYWSLFDESSSIRRLAIMTCGSLYKSEYVVKNLEAFTKKSLSAIVKRSQDVNKRVAAVALGTISGIHRHVPWLLKGIALDPIFLIAYGQGWKAAKASELIHEVFEDLSTNNIQFIFNTVMFVEESMVQLGEDIDIESAMIVLVENIFPHSHLELTDWTAWRQLLLGDSLDQSKHLQHMACLLLLEIINHVSICADDRYFIETDFPLAPSLDSDLDQKNKSRKPVDEMLQAECLNHLVKMTSVFGPLLLQLLEKYKENHKCLTKLVTIPQYFNGTIDSLDMKGICCYLTHLRSVLCDSRSLDAVHRSLACVYHLMSVSRKWKHFIPHFERILFKVVTEKFLNACTRLANRPLPPRCFQNNDLKIVKRAFYLSKFFDVTKTCLLEDAVYALRYGAPKKNAKIVCPTMMMCLYILEWQLKNIIEGNLTTARLYKIQSQSRTLVIQLELLTTTPNSLLRETAYSVLCRLFTTFCRFNVYTSRHRLIHLPPPSLEIAEWFNYGLACQVPVDNIPEDENAFKMSCVALQMFCSLLETQMLNLHYVSSILRYFHFYHYPKNYNSILESTFRVLARMEDFAHVIIDSLIWMKSITNYDIEEITKGICTVALPKLHSTKLVQKTAREIVGYGLHQIRSRRHYFVFQLLAHFVKLLESKDAEEFYSSVVDTFHLYTETDDVKRFLAAVIRTRQKSRGVHQVS